MAITNIGFDGSVSAVQFAKLSQYQGAIVPVVCGKDDLAVAANPAATLTCTIQAGSSAGQGVLTTSDAVASVTFDAVTVSGQTRWDAVVLRRSWASSGSASFVVVKGTASAGAAAVLPSGVDLVLDSGHDHVLALVQITYGNTVPTAVIDRRAWGHKVFTYASTAAMPAASAALIGMQVVVDGAHYRCGLVAGTPDWISDTDATVVVSPGSALANWTLSSLTVTKVGKVAFLNGAFTRTTSDVNADINNGNMANTGICQLISAARPVARTMITIGYASNSVAGLGSIEVGGGISIWSGAPGVAITVGNSVSLSAVYLTS